METIEILNAQLRNAEADRDRFKKQWDELFREKEEYRQKYEEAKSRSQLDNMESMLSRIIDFLMGKGDVSLSESVTNPLIQAVTRQLQEQHAREMKLKEEEAGALKLAMQRMKEEYETERKALYARIAELEGRGGGKDGGPSGPSKTGGKVYATREEALAALEQMGNRNASLIEDRFAQSTESKKYCGRKGVDTENAEISGEGTDDDRFDESTVCRGVRKAVGMVLARLKKKRPRTVQPWLHTGKEESFRDDFWNMHKMVEPDGLPEGATYMGQEDIVRFIVVKAHVKAVHYHLKFYMKDGKCYKAKCPSGFIGKCRADSSLIAHVLYQHYAGRMTYGMLQKSVADMGCRVSQATLKNWVAMGADCLEPLMEPLRREMIEGDRLQTDETTVEVESRVEGEKRPHYHKEWMYNFLNPAKKLTQYRYKDGDRGSYVIVDYLDGRDKSITLYMNGDGSKMMETFHPGHSNEGENVVHIPCAAHMRRPFWNLRNVEPEAKEISDCFDELFIRNRSYMLRGLSPGEIREERLKDFPDILQKISGKLDRLSGNRDRFRHKDLYAAVDYVRRLWPYFLAVLKRGDVSLDNNLCEQQMRPIAIYRNNSLFCGSHKGAERLANVMSLIQSCRLQKLNVYDYISDVLKRIRNYAGNLVDLLPHKWQPAPVTA